MIKIKQDLNKYILFVLLYIITIFLFLLVNIISIYISIINIYSYKFLCTVIYLVLKF